jgi:hypothetical protein
MTNEKSMETGAIKERFTFHDLRAVAGSDAEDNAQKLHGHTMRQLQKECTKESLLR